MSTKQKCHRYFLLSHFFLFSKIIPIIWSTENWCKLVKIHQWCHFRNLRIDYNITLIHEDIQQVYHKLFDKALDEYNAKQKRKDRQIKSYYEKISRSKQEKLFYEVIIQSSNKYDTGAGKGVWVYEAVCDWWDKSAGEVFGMDGGEG